MLSVRNQDGNINVFQNVCCHRGIERVDAAKQLCGPITYPYHAWTYGSDGAALRKTPHLGGPGIHTHVSVKHCKYPLNTIRAHLWHDIIFVNIRVQRPNLMTKLRALSASGVNLNNQFIMAAQTYLSVSRLIVTGNWLSKITAIFIISHLCIRH